MYWLEVLNKQLTGQGRTNMFKHRHEMVMYNDEHICSREFSDHDDNDDVSCWMVTGGRPQTIELMTHMLGIFFY